MAASGEGGPTRPRADRDLDPSITHYWRVYASDADTRQIVADRRLQDCGGARWRRGRRGGGGGGGTTNGCGTVALSYPQMWFFQLVGRAKGSDVSDWYAVPARSGIPDGLGTLAEAAAKRVALRDHAAVRRRRSARPAVPADGNARRPRRLHEARRYPRGCRRRRLRWTWKEWRARPTCRAPVHSSLKSSQARGGASRRALDFLLQKGSWCAMKMGDVKNCLAPVSPAGVEIGSTSMHSTLQTPPRESSACCGDGLHHRVQRGHSRCPWFRQRLRGRHLLAPARMVLDLEGHGPDADVAHRNDAELATVAGYRCRFGASSAKFARSGLRLRVRNSDLGRRDRSQTGRWRHELDPRRRPADEVDGTGGRARWGARKLGSDRDASNFAMFLYDCDLPAASTGCSSIPAAYFFYVIGRKPGDRARYWFGSDGQQRHSRPAAALRGNTGPQFYGMTQQAGSFRASLRRFPPRPLESQRCPGTVLRVGHSRKQPRGPGSLPSKPVDGRGYDCAGAPSPTETTPSTVALSFPWSRSAPCVARTPRTFFLISERTG